jgi:hypothetical protein
MVRAIPARARRAADHPVTSRPRQTIAPRDGGRRPETMLINVVSRAPFGPMSARK